LSATEHSDRCQARIKASWLQALHAQGNILYLHGASDSAVRGRIERSLVQLDISACRWQLQEQDQLEPLSPYIPLLRQLIEQRAIDVEQLLERLAIRGQFARMFLHLLQEKRVKRDEAVVPDDLSYELTLTRRIIATLLRELAGIEPLAIAISGFEHAGESAWQVMHYLGEALADCRCMIIVGLNPDARHRSEARQHSWDLLLTQSEDQTQLLPASESQAGQWPQLVRPLPKDDRGLLAHCGRLLFLLCLPEALAACSWVEKLFQQRRIGDSSGQMMHLLAIKGHALLYSRDFESCVGVFDRILEQAQLSGNQRSLLRAYRNLCWVHIFQSDYQSAIQYANQSLKFSNMLGDGKESVVSLFALYVASDKSTTSFGLQRFREMVHELENFQQHNSYIYALRTLYAQRDSDPAISNRVAMKACGLAMKQARHFGSLAQIASVYQNRAVIYDDIGRNTSALRCYLLSEKLRATLDDAAELARVRNGIGFYYCLQENYQQSFDYYCKALNTSIQIREFNEVAVSLYNLATLYSLNNQFVETNILLDKLRELVRIRRARQFPFRNLHDIHLLQGLAYAAQKNWIRAEQCLERSNRLSQELSSLGGFYRPLLLGMLEIENGDPQQAELQFKAAKGASENTGAASIKHRLIALRSLAYALMQQQRHSEAEEILRGAETFAEAHGYRREIRRIAQQRATGLVLSAPETALPVPELQLDHLIALARQEDRINQLWLRLREVRLISALQKLLSREPSAARIASETLQMIGAHLSVQAGFIYSRSEQGLQRIASFEERVEAALNADELAQRMNRNQETLLLQNHSWRFVQGECVTSSVLSIPLMDGNRQLGLMLLITFEPDIRLNEHDKELMTVLATQMSYQLVRVRQQERLIELSTVDSLTGLHNRQATQTRIREELLRLKRYGKPGEQLALAFIDLDNFKYYNDTWGHEIGDLMLCCFAQLFRQQLRETDLAGRWGGDEFIALLPMVSLQQAAICGERILQQLQLAEGFQQQLSKALGKNIIIPKQQQLTCSIGIAAISPDSGEADLGEARLIRYADEMVYQVKRGGKGKVSVYQPSNNKA